MEATGVVARTLGNPFNLRYSLLLAYDRRPLIRLLPCSGVA